MEKETRILYEFDNNKMNLFNEHIFNNNMDIASMTHNKLNWDNDEELFCLLKKIIPKQTIILKLLEHEMVNYNPKYKINILNELIKKIFWILNKYNLLFVKYLEDTEWELVENSNIFEIDDNTKIIMNTINKNFRKNEDFVYLMNSLICHINKYVVDYPVKYKIIDDEQHEVVWVLIIIKK
jgi:hypothetical protein